MQADHRLFRRRQLVDEFRHVVFQKLLAVGLKARNRRAAVGRIGAGQTEIQRIAAGTGLQRLQAGLGRMILIFREGLRIDHSQTNLAAGAGRDLFEKLAHPRSHRA